MSVVVMAAVYKSRLGCVYRKAVALKLADCADDDGSSAYPSVATICDHAEIGERTVQRKLRELEQISVIRVDVRGGGSGRTTRYEFCMPTLYGLAARSLEVIETDRGPRSRPVDGCGKAKGAAPAPMKKGAAGAEKGAAHDKKGCRSGTRPIIDSSKTHPHGERGQGVGSDIRDILERIARDRGLGDVVDRLLRPVLDRREFRAPNVAATLEATAAWVAGQVLTPDELASTAADLIEQRGSVVTEAAVRAAVAATLRRRVQPAAALHAVPGPAPGARQSE